MRPWTAVIIGVAAFSAIPLAAEYMMRLPLPVLALIAAVALVAMYVLSDPDSPRPQGKGGPWV